VHMCHNVQKYHIEHPDFSFRNTHRAMVVRLNMIPIQLRRKRLQSESMWSLSHLQPCLTEQRSGTPDSSVPKKALAKAQRTLSRAEKGTPERRETYMIKGDLVLTIPNPHRKEISTALLSRILKQANLTREEWLEK